MGLSLPVRWATTGVVAIAALLSSPGVWASRNPSTQAAPPAQNPCASTHIQSPLQGDVLQGSIPVYGSARIDDFNFYKLEYASTWAPDDWWAVSTTRPAPVVSGLLDVWDTSRVDDGEYRLKLTAVDSIGQEVCRYTIAGLLVANQGTPTPTATLTPEESPTPEPTRPPAEPTSTPTPIPTAEIILPQGETVSRSPFEIPAGLLPDVGDIGLFDSFAKGFGGALVLALFGLIVVRLRGR